MYNKLTLVFSYHFYPQGEGICYRGRVLIAIDCFESEPCETGTVHVQDIKESHSEGKVEVRICYCFNSSRTRNKQSSRAKRKLFLVYLALNSLKSILCYILNMK